MDIQSARALKAEITERIVAPSMEASARQRYGVAAGSLQRMTVEAGIALGIAPGRGAGDYRLAVRLQRRALQADPGLRERIEETARREADIRYIGSVFKGTAPVRAAVPWQQARQRPLLVGCSIGHFAVTAGTLGAFAADRETGAVMMVSNNHVIANEDQAAVGDAILQPGAYDGGRLAEDRVGALARTVPLKADGGNLVDAAIAVIDADIGYEAATLTGLGTLKGQRPDPVEPGDAVAKVGRTTAATHGVVTAIELDAVVVSYERGEMSFDRQIEIESTGATPFSGGGDSGSVIVDGNGLACALLFAGSDHGGAGGLGLTYANDLALALDALDVTLAVAPPVS